MRSAGCGHDAPALVLPLARLARARPPGCRACVEAGHPLESLPVLAPRHGQRAYLYGQAPGIQEGLERRPWRGRAGRTLRSWLDLDEDDFYATFYCASVTRCYPGKPPSGRGDRTPTPEEQRLCAFWRERELAILRPRLVVTVGGLAARRLLGIDDASPSALARDMSSRTEPSRCRSRTPPVRAAGSTRPRTGHASTDAVGARPRGARQPRKPARRLERVTPEAPRHGRDVLAPARVPAPVQALARRLASLLAIASPGRDARLPVADRRRSSRRSDDGDSATSCRC